MFNDDQQLTEAVPRRQFALPLRPDERLQAVAVGHIDRHEEALGSRAIMIWMSLVPFASPRAREPNRTA